MQKKRVTRLSAKDKHPHLNEFKLYNQELQKQHLSQKNQTKSKSNKLTQAKQKKSTRSSNEKLEIEHSKTQNQNSNQLITKEIKQIKKKKVTKKEQNQGIRILQERQTQKIFQYLCNPDGLINVESLGKIMVRAKKDFQIEDLQNMISYYDTIKKKLSSQNESTSNQDNKTKKTNFKQKQKVQKTQLISQLQENSEQQSNFEDELDQSDNDQQIEAEEKSQLTFEEFKILKSYFER